MSDDTTTDTAATDAPAGDDEKAAEQATDGTDWKSEARKWERRAKDSASSLTKLEARAEAAEAKASGLEREVLRLTVAAENGITGEYVDLVRGDDEKSLRAAAEKVARLIASGTPAQQQAAPMLVAGEGRTPAVALNSDKLADDLARLVGA
jgi:hypothetical protein